jgi:superfamily I DNA/RNA helicase
LPQGRHVFTTLGKEAFLKEYIGLCRQNGTTEAVAICHSNNHAYDLNRYMRQQLHGQRELQAGELLMVVQNSYDVALVNGDQVQVVDVAFDCHRAGFTFLNIKVTSAFSDTVYETKIIRNLLYNAHAGLSPEETSALLIDFDQRMRQKGLSRNSSDYKEAMRNDPYLNALRAKFGYAITVHKAQGGEWKNVFLYLNSSIYAQVYDNPDGPDKFHRWFYTAITRAREKLVVNDCPFVEGFARRHPKEHAQYWKDIQRSKNKKDKQPS